MYVWNNGLVEARGGNDADPLQQNRLVTHISMTIGI